MPVDVAVPKPNPAPAIGILVGLALGSAAATVVAAVGIALQSRAYRSLWTEERIDSARDMAAVVGVVAVGLGLLVFVAWFATAQRAPEQPRRWRIALPIVLALLVAAAFAASVVDAYTSYWLSVVSALLVAGIVGVLLKRPGWNPARVPMAWSGLVAALAIGGTALAIPYVRHQVPSRELIDWWAAHDNPPIAFYAPLSELSTALDATPRKADEVVAACRSLQQAFEEFGGPPAAPEAIRSDVATVSADLVAVGEQCEAEAETITVEQAEALVTAATSSDAARRIDAALNP